MTQNSNKPIKCEWMKDLNKNKSVVGDPAWGPALSTDKITRDRDKIVLKNVDLMMKKKMYFR